MSTNTNPSKNPFFKPKKVKSTKPDEIHIYTDGSCLSNPGGSGGWAFVVVCRSEGCVIQSCYGHGYSTTNNQMELTAAAEALERVSPARLTIHTDSKYLIRGATELIPKWRKNNYYKVKNAELWIRIDKASKKHKRVKWKWIKGHSDHKYNLEADRMARQGADEAEGLTKH